MGPEIPNGGQHEKPVVPTGPVETGGGGQPAFQTPSAEEITKELERQRAALREAAKKAGTQGAQAGAMGGQEEEKKENFFRQAWGWAKENYEGKMKPVVDKVWPYLATFGVGEWLENEAKELRNAVYKRISRRTAKIHQKVAGEAEEERIEVAQKEKPEIPVEKMPEWRGESWRSVDAKVRDLAARSRSIEDAESDPRWKAVIETRDKILEAAENDGYLPLVIGSPNYLLNLIGEGDEGDQAKEKAWGEVKQTISRFIPQEWDNEGLATFSGSPEIFREAKRVYGGMGESYMRYLNIEVDLELARAEVDKGLRPANDPELARLEKLQSFYRFGIPPGTIGVLARHFAELEAKRRKAEQQAVQGQTQPVKVGGGRPVDETQPVNVGRSILAGESPEDFRRRQLEEEARFQREQFEISERNGEGAFDTVPALGSPIFYGMELQEQRKLRARMLVANARAKIQAQTSTDAVTDITELKVIRKEELDDLTKYQRGANEAWFIYTSLTARPDIMLPLLQKAGLEQEFRKFNEEKKRKTGQESDLGMGDIVFLAQRSAERLEEARLVFARWMGGKFGLPQYISEVGVTDPKELREVRINNKKAELAEAVGYNLMRIGRVPESVDTYFNNVYGANSKYLREIGLEGKPHSPTSIAGISAYGVRLVLNPGAEIWNSDVPPPGPNKLSKEEKGMWPRSGNLGAGMYREINKHHRLKLWQPGAILENAYARIDFVKDNGMMVYDKKTKNGKTEDLHFKLLETDENGSVLAKSLMIQEAKKMLENPSQPRIFDWSEYTKGPTPFFRYEFYGVKRAAMITNLLEHERLPKVEGPEKSDAEAEIFAAVDMINREDRIQRRTIKPETCKTIFRLIQRQNRRVSMPVNANGELGVRLDEVGAYLAALHLAKRKYPGMEITNSL